jgi:hypothetical protein
MKATLAYRMMIWTGVLVLLIWSLGPIYWTHCEFGYAKRRLLDPADQLLFRSTLRWITIRGCSASTLPGSEAWKSSSSFGPLCSTVW